MFSDQPYIVHGVALCPLMLCKGRRNCRGTGKAPDPLGGQEDIAMIRRLIGGAIGARLAKRHPVLGGATGVALATAVPFVISRVSLPAMMALGAGGYVAKRYIDRREQAKTGSDQRSADPE
jgi:hypothetical protein